MKPMRLWIEQLESRKLLAAYTLQVVDQLDLVSSETEQLIARSANYALTRMSQLIDWKGVLDTEIRIRPASENPDPNANGLMPSIISLSPKNNKWSNDTLQEMLTGIDPKPQTADAGMTIYLGRDGQIRNWGFLVWFDPNPIAYVPADVPKDSFDFIGVVWHEVFHSIGFLGASTEFSTLTTVLNGNDYFIGQRTQQVFGGPLPLVPRVNGWLGDHYGNTSLPNNSLNSGLMFQWGNYAFNRLDIGRLDLAVLEDLGITIKNIVGLPLVDIIDQQLPKNTLSKNSIKENAPIGTVVGTLSTTAGSSGFTFEFADGGTDNSAFSIQNAQLVTRSTVDFEIKKSYSIRIKNSDSNGVWTVTPMVVSVEDVNETPFNINLSKATILENDFPGAVVGSLSTTDPDVGGSFTYSLVAGVGSGDNSAFQINGTELLARERFDFESKSSYSIRVRSTDQGGLSVEKVFTITVVNTNDAPVLQSTSGFSLGSMLEGEVDGLGRSVGDFLIDGSITDQDGVSVEAIAIVGLDVSLGTWQYSLDAGKTWLSVDATAINSQVNQLGLLLSSTALLRLRPFGDLHGVLPSGITFRAWDRTSGTEGSYTVLASVGDASAYSVTTASASITVSPVNDAPVFLRDGGPFSVEIGGNGGGGTSSALQSDGKLVVAGFAVYGLNYDFAVMRFNTDGSLDTTFGDGGKLTSVIGTSDEWGTSVVIQPDGKILVAGWCYLGSHYDFAMIRFNTNGSFDTSFGIGGKVTTSIGTYHDVATCMTLLPDGRVLVGGYAAIGSTYDFALIQYNTDGSLDTTFGNGGKVVTAIGSGHDIGWSIVRQADGKIVLGGKSNDGKKDDFALVRYNANGSLDTTFGSGGKVITSVGLGSAAVTSLVIQPDGRILVGGTCTNGSNDDFALVRYTVTGALDTSFGNGGKVVTSVGSGKDTGSSIRLQSDGKILQSGSSFGGKSEEFALVRYHVSGALDTSFGSSGRVITEIGVGNDISDSISVQPDGRIVAAGKSNNGARDSFALVRYKVDGTIDDTFGSIPANRINTTANYTEGGVPVLLDQLARVFDTELSETHFDGSVFTLQRRGGVDLQDRFTSSGTLGSITEGSSLQVDGKVIGSVTRNSGGVLTLTFSAAATNSLVNSAIQQLAYSNTSDAPPPNVVIEGWLNDSNTGTQGSGGSLSGTKAVTVTISNVNDRPSDINLSQASITENNEVNALVGVFSTIDPDVVDSFSYSLVGGSGDTDNSSFVIEGNSLRAKERFDFESKSSYSIRVRSTDQGGLSVEKVFTITVVNTNDAPIAFNDHYTVFINDISLLEVTLNDYEFDDSLALNILEIVSLPNSGTVVVNGGKIEYQPNMKMIGRDFFSYRIRHVNGAVSNSANVELILIERPFGSSDVAYARRDETIYIDVLSNDNFIFSPLNRQTVRIVQEPINGNAAVVDGVIRFTPTMKFLGQVNLWYTVRNVDNYESLPIEVVVEVNGSLYRNPKNPFDVNDDNWTNAMDALVIINELNRRGGGPIESINKPAPPYYDANGDYHLTAIDALVVINYLQRNHYSNNNGDGNGLGEGEFAVDRVFGDLASNRDQIGLAEFFDDLDEQIQRRKRTKI